MPSMAARLRAAANRFPRRWISLMATAAGASEIRLAISGISPCGSQNEVQGRRARADDSGQVCHLGVAPGLIPASYLCRGIGVAKETDAKFQFRGNEEHIVTWVET